MRRSWVIAGGLLFWVGCTTSMKVGDDGPGGAESTSTSSSTSASVSASSSSGSGDPCSGVACTTPSAPECISATTLRVREAVGTCDAGACSYATTDSECPGGCVGGACVIAPVAISVRTGGNTTCALVSGGVHCWGWNYHGALGNNSTVDSHVPVDVVGLSSGVAQIAVLNQSAACALTSSGAVKCWGDNGYGQLGDNSGVDSHVPVDVVGLSPGIVAIAAAGPQACAITAAGGLECWGDNSQFQLGSSAAVSFPIPIAVPGLPPITAVAMGISHTCALTAAGGVKCWGSNDSGALGNNDGTGPSAAPVDVIGLGSGVAAISAGGQFTCALLATGAVKCWGYRNGLCDPALNYSPVPIDIPGLSSGVVSVTACLNGACALLATGGVKCWGINDEGELGDGTTTTTLGPPSDAMGLSSGVVALSIGTANHHCAVLASGQIKCWGSNVVGQLGNNATAQSGGLVEVVGY